MSVTGSGSTGVKVSVAMITYNHEQFIAQAIESVLRQQTDYAYELVIGEDCSTDGTRAIVAEYAQNYPEQICPLLHEHNLGLAGKNNLVAVLRACKGQYVAILEGDDYWIDPCKLQKQIDVLENDPNISGCFSNAIVVDDCDALICDDYFAYYQVKVKTEIRTEDIVPFGISPTNTILFRRKILTDPPDWFTRNMRHSGFDLLITLHGIYHCSNEKLGAYRIHPGGVWSSSPLADRFLSDLMYLKPMFHDEYMNRNYGGTIERAIYEEVKALCASGAQGENYLKIVKYLVQFALAYPRSAELSKLTLKAVLSGLLAPQWQKIVGRFQKASRVVRRVSGRIA